MAKAKTPITIATAPTANCTILRPTSPAPIITGTISILSNICLSNSTKISDSKIVSGF